MPVLTRAYFHKTNSINLDEATQSSLIVREEMTAAPCRRNTVLPRLLPDLGGDVSSGTIFRLGDWQASLPLSAHG